LGLDWVKAERWGLDAGKSEQVFRHNNVRLAKDRICECDVEPEGLAVRLARE